MTVVDINNDGWLDIYVSCTILTDPRKRENLLYINQGTNKDDIPHFKEMAAEYGLNDTTYTTMAAFFDYDNDGDLDVYLAVNEIPKAENPNHFRNAFVMASIPVPEDCTEMTGRIAWQHPFFVNVSKEAGITHRGVWTFCKYHRYQ